MDPSPPPPLDDWKSALRRDFEQWLDSVDAIPGMADDDDEPPDAPDLRSFYDQLAASTTEARKANRRTAEAFSQWSDTLSRFEGDLRQVHEQLARQPGAADDALSRSWCLALIELTDRLHRLAAAFATPPRRAWWGTDERWRTAWETQRQAHDILVSHADALLTNAGVTRITTLHQQFDPATMSAVATQPDTAWPHQTVIEEIAPGYHLRGELLRVAQVSVSSNQHG
jgi:molecular chaperone GrpE (heat shock protein)